MSNSSLTKQMDTKLEKIEWIESGSQTIQSAISRFYNSMGSPGKKVQNFLNGSWLGHPLHPVLVDIPIGAWAAALLLDFIEMTSGKKKFGRAADAAVGLGSAAAAAAAVAGVTDWQHTAGEARRTGFIHALLNSAALVLFIASLFSRRSGRRPLGKSLALAGFSIAGFSAYLGGDLVFRQRIGVKHGEQAGPAENFKVVLPETELAEGQMRRVMVADRPVLLARQQGRIFAISEVCSHMGGPLSEGWLRPDASVICPWHGSRFDLQTGRVLDGPSAYPQAVYEVKTQDGEIWVRRI